MTMPAELLGKILRSKPEAIATLAEWLARHREIAKRYDEPILCAIAAGAGTDRLAWAFGSGYQCAGRKLVPSLDPMRLGALCATEMGGAHPRAIETRLENSALYGTKAFVTFGMEAEQLIVIASESRTEDRNQLRAVLIDRDAPGLFFEPLGETPFVPEISHATLRMDGARGRVLEGDGYLAYLKPFRTIEDTHVLAAALAHMVGLGNMLKLEGAFFERSASVLLALIQVSRMPPLDPATHVALAGAQDSLRTLIEILDAAKPGELWTRDRALFSVAGKARAQRRTAAWAKLMANGD
jgi:alkylation response protein AidB-like acyl-CoA dehydrogenase